MFIMTASQLFLTPQIPQMSPYSLPDTMPLPQQQIVNAMVDALVDVPGIVAIVLGGSHARGTARADSDVDLGLYYREGAGLDIEAVRAVARRFHVSGEPTVTELYSWGRWVNGGAWIQTIAGKVDFLYRNVDQVARVIADAQAGRTEIDFEQQPTLGFHCIVYLAETSVCRPVFDPDGVVGRFKESVQAYPPALKARMTGDSLWSADFTLMHAAHFAERGDVFNTVGCLLRAVYYLTHTLYAVNEVYYAGDKGALEQVRTFGKRPASFANEVDAVLAQPGRTPDELQSSVTSVRRVFSAVVDAVGDYQPRY